MQRYNFIMIYAIPKNDVLIKEYKQYLLHKNKAINYC